MIERARGFFAAAVDPIEKTHRTAREAGVRVDRLSRKLRRRQREESASRRNLQEGILRRRAAEADLKKSRQRHARLLGESSRLEKRLRNQEREIMLAREDERRKISRRLHDEITQTLVAVNLRLLRLQETLKTGRGSLEKEIDEAQRLVGKSGKMISRFVDESTIRHQA